MGEIFDLYVGIFGMAEVGDESVPRLKTYEQHHCPHDEMWVMYRLEGTGGLLVAEKIYAALLSPHMTPAQQQLHMLAELVQNVLDDMVRQAKVVAPARDARMWTHDTILNVLSPQTSSAAARREDGNKAWHNGGGSGAHMSDETHAGFARGIRPRAGRSSHPQRLGRWPCMHVREGGRGRRGGKGAGHAQRTCKRPLCFSYTFVRNK